MSELLSESEPDRLQRGFKFGTIAASLAVAVSYVLPWVALVGPTASADQEAVAVENITGETASSGSIEATEIVMFPELMVVFAVLAAGLSVLRWNRPIQSMSGLLGILGTVTGILFLRFLTTDSEEIIQVGEYVGLPGAFQPGVGFWIALVGSACIALCGIGSFVHASTADEP